MHKKTTRALLGGVVAAGLAVATLTGGTAAGASDQYAMGITKTYADNFVGPLQLAVGNGKIYVADSFRSALFQLGNPNPIATRSGSGEGGLDGVGINRANGDIAYTETTYGQAASLTILHNGKKVRSADLLQYESTHNPDKGVQYGLVGKTTDCQRKAVKKATGLPPRYKGLIDSHPYAVTRLLYNNWAVADAAGNDILRVDSAGNISTIAVLPAVFFKITEEFVQENDLPECLVGATYRFESVPTDAEFGPDGTLYVSTLPGGEIPGSGRVYRINIHTGEAFPIAKGFNLAVNLALAPNGEIFVSELATGNIQVIRDGVVSTVFNLPGVVGLQYANGALYASTAPALFGAQEPGHVYRLQYR